MYQILEKIREEDKEENLKRFYPERESLNRLLKITAYFEENLKIFANLSLHYQNKYIIKNINEKQKLIYRNEIIKKIEITKHEVPLLKEIIYCLNDCNYFSFFSNEVLEEIKSNSIVEINNDVTKQISTPHNNNDSVHELIEFIVWAEKNTDRQVVYDKEKPPTSNNMMKRKESLMKNIEKKIDNDTLEFKRKKSVNLQIEKRINQGKIIKLNIFKNNISKNIGGIISNLIHKKENGKFKKNEEFINFEKEKQNKELNRLEVITTNFLKEKEKQYKNIMNNRSPKSNKIFVDNGVFNKNDNIYNRTLEKENSSRKPDNKKINHECKSISYDENVIISNFTSENKNRNCEKTQTESDTLKIFEYSPFIINKIDFQNTSNSLKHKLVFSNNTNKIQDKANQFSNIKSRNYSNKRIMTDRLVGNSKKTNLKTKFNFEENLPTLINKFEGIKTTQSKIFLNKQNKQNIMSSYGTPQSRQLLTLKKK